MLQSISYARYLDKVYGCFLGKTVSGTIGAPYEGVKMPMELPFSPAMIDAMLPNDDLDLQVLWLDVAERKGPDFTAADLLDRFVTHCDYSPGEYAVMRKNHAKGIAPPLSGRFCNDFYREGMGCPIRSELWACLAPGNPALAADFARRDGCCDHFGASIEAERFFAALEAMAFFSSDLHALIDRALVLLPPDSRFAALVRDTVALCARYGGGDDADAAMKTVFNKLLYTYGHPDCTNLYQNMGITLAALLLGGLDIVKTSMLALNCGFDTDCTCASAGAVVGLIRGADELKRAYGLSDVKYVLSVRSDRRSDSVYDLAEDVARLGVCFAGLCDPAVTISDAPDCARAFAAPAPIEAVVTYEDDCPSIGFGETRGVAVTLRSRTDAAYRCALDLALPAPLRLDSPLPESVLVQPDAPVLLPLRFSVPDGAETLMERNVAELTLTAPGLRRTVRFGLSGAAAWKALGPIWRTEPVTDTASLLAAGHYSRLIGRSALEGSDIDRIRHLHLNFAADRDTAFLTEQQLFAPVRADDDWTDSTVGRCEARRHNLHEDSFTLSRLFGFQGPCTVYLARELVAPEDMTVCLQLGHSAPYSLWVNGALVSRRDQCDTWVSENVHIAGLALHQGVNRIVLRIARVNADAKFDLIFSKQETCAEQLVCFGSVNPARW